MKHFSLVLVLALSACAGLTPGGTSPSNAGAPQPATNLAQTARDQAAVPSQSYGGQGLIEYRFASEADAAVRMKLIELAREGNWTPEQIAAAFSAASSAPQEVTLTGNANAAGGDASSIGSGTGGGVGASGAGTVTR